MSERDADAAISETLGVVSLDVMAWTWIRRRSIGQWGLLALVGLVAAGVLGSPGPVLSAAFFLALGAAVLAAGARNPPKQRVVTASLAGLQIEGRPNVPAHRLLGATIAKVPTGYQVDVARRFGTPIRLVSARPEQARRIVDALGLGLDRRVFQARLLSPIVGPRALAVGWGVAISAFLALALQAPTSGGSVTAWFCAVFTAVVLANLPTRLRVGRDGLETRWLWRRRSLRIAEVARLEALPRTWVQPHRVRVHRHRGAPLDLPVSQRPKGHPAGLEEVSRVIERIEAAMQATARAGDPRFGEWNRSRVVLPPEAWLAALRIGDGEYREATMPFDGATLVEVLDDPHAPIEDRAGAAVALGARGDEALKRRLLDVARSTALPELVSVLEAVRAHDDRALLRALARVPRARVEVPPEATPEAADGPPSVARGRSGRARFMR